MEPVPVPIEEVLDLHPFRPQDVKEVVLEYLAQCEQRGFCEVRIIHGKGIGELRRTVHHLLERHPRVASFGLASDLYGGHGATVVRLKAAGTD